MKNICSTCLRICASTLTIIAAFTASATQYSKLRLITAAKEAGKWPALKSWIESAGYWDEWLVCDYLSDEYEIFPAVTNAVVTSGVATLAEVESLLEASRDKAPDALLPVVYGRDIQSDGGRVKWHGSRIGQYEIDMGDGTYRLVQLYADGFAYTNAAKIIHRDDPEAEAKRRAEAERRRQEYERAHLHADVAAILAARRAAAATTNETTVIIVQSTPGGGK